MRRMENDLLFFHELIGNCSVEKDSKIYTISPKFGKGTMQSFEVMPGAERDSQLAREIEAALPRELSGEQQLALVRAYVKDNFVDKGMQKP